MNRVSPEWLALREPADAAARSSVLLEPLRHKLSSGPTVVHDLGCGTGSMARWLAPRLPGLPHWVLYDRDEALLKVAADGVPGTVEVHQRDITRLTPDDLDGASLVTASALLDMFTLDEVERVVAACVRAGCPALFTISVVGRVALDPADPLDAEVTAAFNAHQRRTTGGRTLLGPDAVEATVAAFGRHGVGVQVAESPWVLGPDEAALTSEWFAGWLGAAVEQCPDLAPRTVEYARRRRVQAVAGELRAVVHHTDLLADPH
jgi:SAM-dependent methyltransferase